MEGSVSLSVTCCVVVVVVVVGFIVFLGQLLLVMFAQHEHYEMPGMQWPKCVKHVHKVTIKPI